MTFKVGTRIRSRRTGIVGKVTEVIEIEQGHQVHPPLAGTEHPNGKYSPRTDLRVEYEDDDGKVIGEQLVHADDAVKP
jgi:hypothetical protein